MGSGALGVEGLGFQALGDQASWYRHLHGLGAMPSYNSSG